MALIVEDGTGLTAAESYLAVSDADAYHAARGNTTWASLDTTTKEQALRSAASYIDTIQRYKGFRLTQAQALEFPRTSCFDWSGFPAEGVPARVKQACAELALRASGGSLYADLSRGGKVKSEAVGPISTTYADDAPVGMHYTQVMNLLLPYSRVAGPRMGGPSFSQPTTDPYFQTGVHDFPAVGGLSPTES